MMEEKIDKTVFQIAELTSDYSSLDYWLSKTPDERMAAVELLRRINYGINASTGRLARVLEVAEFPPS